MLSGAFSFVAPHFSVVASGPSAAPYVILALLRVVAVRSGDAAFCIWSRR